MASKPFRWKYALLPPPPCYHASSAAADEFKLLSRSWKLEAAHGSFVCLCKGLVQITGVDFPILRTPRAAVHVTWHKFRHLCRFNMHYDTSGELRQSLKSRPVAESLVQVAITSPDPDFNTDARDYFTRQMRLLESCTSAWPMPDMQTQIDALREAFSADTSRPFELKPSFPYGSPGTNLQPSPSLDVKYPHNNLGRPNSHEHSGPLFHPHPLTPPPISGDHEDQDRPLAAASLTMMANGQQQPMPLVSTSIETDQAAWNPTRIFEYGSEKNKTKVKSSTNKVDSQWTTAFGTPSSMIGANNNQPSEPSPPLYTPASVGSHDLPPLHNAMEQQQYPVQSSMPPLSRIQIGRAHV